MSRSLKRLARRALINRHKDLYYHDLMQLRREQQLEAILQRPSVVVEDHHHHHDCTPEPYHDCLPEPCTVPDYVCVNKDFDMSCRGPSSQDWMLVLMIVLGTAGMTLIICLLLFLAVNAIGLVTTGATQ